MRRTAVVCLADLGSPRQLQHAGLRPLWTSAPETLAYLIKLDEEQVERILALPNKLARP